MKRVIPPDPSARILAFDRILIEHSRLIDLRKQMGSLMAQTEQRIAASVEERDTYGQEASTTPEVWILPVIGPSGATKSHSLKNIVASLSAPGRERGEAPILMVKLRSSIRSTKQLQTEILKAFGNKFYKEILTTRAYVESDVSDAIVEIARARKTVLVVLDEAHNMLPFSTAETVRSVAASLKSLVNDGAFSIVMAGTERLRPVCTDGEFGSRMKTPVDFSAASLSKPRSLVEFFVFVQELSAKMFDYGVIDTPFHPLSTKEEMGTVFDMTGGVCGMFARFVRLALDQAHLQDRFTIDWTDLVSAYSAWRSVQDQAGFNPVPRGPRSATVATISQLIGQ